MNTLHVKAFISDPSLSPKTINTQDAILGPLFSELGQNGCLHGSLDEIVQVGSESRLNPQNI